MFSRDWKDSSAARVICSLSSSLCVDPTAGLRSEHGEWRKLEPFRKSISTYADEEKGVDVWYALNREECPPKPDSLLFIPKEGTIGTLLSASLCACQCRVYPFHSLL